MAGSWGENDIVVGKAPPDGGWGANDTALAAKKGPPPKTSQTLGLYKGVLKPWNKVADWAESGAENLPVVGKYVAPVEDAISRATGGLIAPSVKSAKAVQQAQIVAKARQGIVPGKAGEFTGQVLGTLPAVAVTKNPYLLGAIQGGLLSDADTPQGLAFDAATGAVLNKAAGVVGDKVLQVASPVVNRVTRAALAATPQAVKDFAGSVLQPVTDALAPIRRALPPGKAPGTSAEAQAQRYVLAKAAEKGLLTADDAKAIAAKEFANNPDVRGAELMGKEGEGLLAGLSRLGGNTGDEAQSMAMGRLGGLGDRIQTQFTENLGVDPETAAGNLDAVIRAGSERTGGKFRKAFANAGDQGIWNDELESLYRTPAVQRALKGAATEMANTRKPFEGVTMAPLDTPTRPVGPEDLSFAASGAPSEMPVPRGPAAPPSKGMSALTYLRQNGYGIEEAATGENQAMGLRLGARKGGADLNTMAIALHEGGYLPFVPTDTEMETLLNTGGVKRLFAKEPDPATLQRFQARQAAEEFNARGGNADELPHPDQYGDVPPQLGPGSEPAHMLAPNLQGWDKIRREVNQSIDWNPKNYEDIKASIGARAVARDLTTALAGDEKGVGGVSPDLREAIDEGGDYIGIRSANRKFENRLFGNSRQFANDWLKLKPGDREGARAALATQVMDGITSGRIKPGQFQTRDALNNLRTAFGAGADDFATQMAAEARLAGSARRVMPDSGSPTARLKAMQEELDAGAQSAGPDLAEVLHHVAANKSLVGGVVSWAKSQGLKALAQAKNVGVPVEVRNEIGRLLLLPRDEFAAFLEGPPQTDAQRIVQTHLINHIDELGKRLGGSVRATAVQPPGRTRKKVQTEYTSP